MGVIAWAGWFHEWTANGRAPTLVRRSTWVEWNTREVVGLGKNRWIGRRYRCIVGVRSNENHRGFLGSETDWTRNEMFLVSWYTVRVPIQQRNREHQAQHHKRLSVCLSVCLSVWARNVGWLVRSFLYPPYRTYFTS